jgi:hypothetical protein
MNETYSMSTVEQTFSITPAQQAQQAQQAQAKQTAPQAASVLNSPAFWAIALAGFLLYRNSK